MPARYSQHCFLQALPKNVQDARGAYATPRIGLYDFKPP